MTHVFDNIFDTKSNISPWWLDFQKKNSIHEKCGRASPIRNILVKIMDIYVLLVKIGKNHRKTCWLFTVWFPKEMHNTWIVRFWMRQMICTVFAPVSWVFGVRSKFWMLKKGEMLYFTALPNLFETRLHVPIPRRLKTHGWNDWTVTSDCVALHIFLPLSNERTGLWCRVYT